MELETARETRVDIKIRFPSMFAVILHNDDITTMDVVVEILIKIFHMDSVSAAALMMQVHEEGEGIAGVYTFDIASTKKMQSEKYAASKNFPLKLSLREIPDET